MRGCIVGELWLVGFGFKEIKWFSGIERLEFGIGWDRLFAGFHGKLHSGSLWCYVWLHIFDRLALVSTPKALLDSRNSRNRFTIIHLRSGILLDE